MGKKLLFIFFATFYITAWSQEEPKLFPEVVRENFHKYKSESNRAYEKGNDQEGQMLFDTLVSNHLIGTKFEDYSLKKVSGGKLKLSTIKKPVLIQTYTSWCILNKGEIPALNKLARKYAKNLQIIVMFWDKKQSAKNLASQFSSSIEVCYANENYSKDKEVLTTMKYSIGFLTSYFLDENLKVINIKRGPPPVVPKKAPIKDAIKINYDAYNEGLTDLLLKSDIKKEKLATK